MVDRRRARRNRVWRGSRWGFIALGLPLVWACNDRTLERPTPAVNVSSQHVFQDAGTRKIDILFMIDNSTSMDSAQANLRDNFPAFMDVLKNVPGGMPDVHIAVVSSDMGAGSGIDACVGDGDGGRFKFGPGKGCTATNLAAGAHFISDTGGANPQVNFTGDIAEVFQCIATLGTAGCGFEHQLASVARALGADGSSPPEENAGFLREDAYLAIVLVTNEDDCSAPVSSPIYDVSTALASKYGPTQNFVCNEWGHLCSRNGGPLAPPSRQAPNNSTADVVTYSPAGGPDGCVSAEGAGMLTRVARGGYADWIKALKKDPANQILVAAIAGPTTPYAVEWVDSGRGDTGPWPRVQHSCGKESDPAGFADPAVRLRQFVDEFGANGLIYPFCSTNYKPALTTIADSLVVLIRPKCIDGAVATRPGSTTPDCTVTEIVSAGESARQTVLSACADNGHTPPCWTLDAPDPTGMNTCAAGTHVVTVDRGGAAPPDGLRNVVECTLCPDGAPPDPTRSCIP